MAWRRWKKCWAALPPSIGNEERFVHGPGRTLYFSAEESARSLCGPADSKAAIEYFLKYLKRKPDDLEVKWQLNLVI